MLELTKSGLAREKAYKIIQKHSKNSYSKNVNLMELIKKDKLINFMQNKNFEFYL